MLPISNKLSLSGTVIIHIVLVPFFLGDYAWFCLCSFGSGQWSFNLTKLILFAWDTVRMISSFILYLFIYKFYRLVEDSPMQGWLSHSL